MSRVKHLRRRQVLATATAVSVAVSFVGMSPATAGKKKEKKPKCTITGTEGPDTIILASFFKPAASYQYHFSEEAETICTLGGDDIVIINADYNHPGTTKVLLGTGNDCANVADNEDAEAVDGGAGADNVAFDIGDGDTVKNVEEDDGCQ